MKKSLLFALSIMFLVSCGTEKKKETTEVVSKKPVKVMPISSKVIPIEEVYTATITAYDKVYLAPNMAGRIEDIKVDVNDNVRKGQTVVTMDASQLVQLEVSFANLQKDMARMDTLIKYGSISQQIYDQTKAEYDATKASLNNLKENTVLLSPFSGVVTGRYYDNKEIYSGSPNVDGKAAILTIESIDRLKVEVNMSERFYPVVKNGLQTHLTTDIYGDEEFTGAVSLVYPTIDPDTRTFTTEITIPNGDRKLRPGMFSKVAVHLGDKEAIVVPSSAVLMLDGTNTRFVYIENDGIAEFTEVKIGTRFDDSLEIISDDINVGDKLIVSGQVNLNNGDQVTIVD